MRSRFRPSTPPPFVLTARDIEVMKAIGLHRVLSSQQLDTLFFPTSFYNLRYRLKCLYHAKYLGRLKSMQQVPASLEGTAGKGGIVYTLLRKGALEVYAARGISLRGYAHDAAAFSLLHELSASEVMLSVEKSTQKPLRLLWLHDLCTPGERQADRWKVEMSWQGQSRTITVIPDRIFAIEDTRRMKGKNRKLFFLERDMGSMTVEKKTMSEPSILRKILSYSATYQSDVLQHLFGFTSFRVLLVTSSATRVKNMLALFQKYQQQIGEPRLFLFCDWPTIRSSANFFDVPWKDGEGREVRLLA